eukprot:NODE_3105_length_706_cov_17.681887_g2198_i0.p5 GENE.NODE_3105_length_706_cov_17.681887_g2198_i0~~NODE_3105_length_706_cov_17.681887_g2198_i0.p5  ORF type:complete len:69 (+),score=15.74 NODE_3105_length_706_cov_17.681887_g2198_i0:236-442(+)
MSFFLPRSTPLAFGGFCVVFFSVCVFCLLLLLLTVLMLSMSLVFFFVCVFRYYFVVLFGGNDIRVVFP